MTNKAAYWRSYYEKHREKILTKNRAWTKAHPEARVVWASANPDKIREYRRRRNAKMAATHRPRPTPQERFEAKCEPEPNSGCILWLGAVTPLGYGNFWDGKRYVNAHKAAYLFKHGAVPAGLEIDHTCRVKPCVNVDHLEAVTHGENIRRAIEALGGWGGSLTRVD